MTGKLTATLLLTLTLAMTSLSGCTSDGSPDWDAIGIGTQTIGEKVSEISNENPALNAATGGGLAIVGLILSNLGSLIYAVRKTVESSQRKQVIDEVDENPAHPKIIDQVTSTAAKRRVQKDMM